MSNHKNTKRNIDDSVRKAIESRKGGKDVIFRLVEAYGFSSRQALCNHLDVSQSTLANRSARDTFPDDWVLICHIETGASLKWLITGKGLPFENTPDSRITTLEYKTISNGMLTAEADRIVDANSLPDGLKKPFLVNADRDCYLVDAYEGEVTDGMWLIKVDNLVSVRELIRFPGGRIRVENGKASFECQISDIEVLGKVISKTEYF
ncbi:phage repressor protein CI [Pantoea sp.]|uniref:phage repressor protein CI n=1 Tax=Pantoea sp. TaxID=69393 RepID=UPI0028A1D60A|nr:phage repressor protein CI [Pantoea sp.]